MRDAAGQMADSVELLRLAQCFLGGRAPIDLGVEPLSAEQHYEQAAKKKQSYRNAVNQVCCHLRQPLAPNCRCCKAGGDIERRAIEAAGGETTLDVIDL